MDEICSNGGSLLFTKTYDIVGGGVYSCITSSSSANAAKECNMYYKMFTCREGDTPEIIEIRVAY